MILRIDLLVVSHADITGKPALIVASGVNVTNVLIISVLLTILIVQNVDALNQQQTLRCVHITWRTRNDSI